MRFSLPWLLLVIASVPFFALAQEQRVPDAVRAIAAPEPASLGPLAQRPASNKRALLAGTERAVSRGLVRPAVSQTADGRRVITASIVSPGAARIRVHFTDFDAGAGEAWVYAPGAETGEGPYTGRGILGTGEFWSGGVDGPAVVVSYLAAPGAATAEFPFAIAAVAHEWATPAASAAPNAAAASCELDVSCYLSYAPWVASAASAVALIDFRGDDGDFYVCSGAMVNTAGVSHLPYFLTANHCIGTATEANTVVAYFLYQTPACNGTPPSLSSVPSLQAATFLTGGDLTVGDYSLLLFAKNAPAGVGFLNTSATLASNATVVGIHHPEGDYTRIAIGTRQADAPTNISGTIAPANLYYQVSWSSGLVEEGSSGSPLLDSNGNLVGTLTAGPVVSTGQSACSVRPTAVYARFSAAASAFGPYLNDTSPTFSANPTHLNFQLTNGAGQVAQTVNISTTSTNPVSFTMTSSRAWLKAPASGIVSASSPYNAAISIDTSVLNTPGTFTGTVTVTPSTGSSSLTLLVEATIGFTRSVVTLALNPNPVFEAPGVAQWNYSLTLTESAGASIQLTGFKIYTYDILGQLLLSTKDETSKIASLFGAGAITGPASVGASVYEVSLAVPALRQFEIDGVDVVGGRTWQVTQNAPFYAAYEGPSLRLTAAPGAVYQNQNSAAACQWTENLIVQETNGYPALLTNLLAGSTDFTSEMARDFGTVRLPAYGSLLGSLCLTSQPSSPVQISGTDDYGNLVSASAGVSSGSKLSNPPALSVTPSSAAITDSSPSVQLAVTLGGNSVAWTASVAAQYGSSWFSLSPASGSGSGTIAVTGNPKGLAAGNYSATLLIVAQQASPQFVAVPVSFRVGPASPKPVINSGGVTNAWDVIKGKIAPGSVISIWGTNLTTGTQAALTPVVPFVNQLNGTVVTINGIQAPLYAVSPAQLNVQVPFEVAAGSAQVVVTVNGQASDPATAQIQAAAPGICGDFSSASAAAGEPKLCVDSTAHVGDYTAVFVTGQGTVSPAVSSGAAPFASASFNNLPRPTEQPVTVTVGGVPATILFAGIPSWSVAVMEIDFVVPSVAPGAQPVVVSVGGQASSPAYIVIAQ